MRGRRFLARAGHARAIVPAFILAAVLTLPAAVGATGFDVPTRESIVARAAELSRLHGLIVAHRGETVIESAVHGPGLDRPVNVKSVAKSVVAALVGAAIDRGLIDGVEQPVAALLPDAVPEEPDPMLAQVTVGNLLSMQAGLDRTSGSNYGRWVTSDNWVDYVLSRPFVDRPGGTMLYSTGNSHLLSAILTRVSGQSTHDVARQWLAEPLGFDLPRWDRDPQGIYFGGNNMLLSPRALLAFGEMFRQGGTFGGQRVLPEGWIADTWTPRTRSRYSGDGYGYGWFIADACGHPAYYARGFGGQFVYVVPAAALTVVITSEETVRTRVDGYYGDLRELVFDRIIPAALGAAEAGGAETGTPAQC